MKAKPKAIAVTPWWTRGHASPCHGMCYGDDNRGYVICEAVVDRLFEIPPAAKAIRLSFWRRPARGRIGVVLNRTTSSSWHWWPRDGDKPPDRSFHPGMNKWLTGRNGLASKVKAGESITLYVKAQWK